MNALKLIEDIKQVIKQEEDFFEKALEYRASSVNGFYYINNQDGRFDEKEIREKLNSGLRNFVHKNLGLGLISNFKENIGRANKGTELEGLHLLLGKYSDCELNANEYIDGLIKLLDIDQDYFYKLIAYNLVFEKLNKDKWYVSIKLSKEDIDESIKKVKFNMFSVSCLSSVDSFNELFMVNGDSLQGFVQILARICNVYSGSCNSGSEFNVFNKLDAFDENHNKLEYKGITLTAQKNGKIKINLDKALEKSLEEKVKPFLKDFNMLFIQ